MGSGKKYKRKTSWKRAPSTAFKPGDPRINRRGRVKGSKNRFSGELKAIVLDALANAAVPGQRVAGAQEYLEHQARKNPRSFLQLISKLLPTQVTGKDDGPLEIKVQEALTGLSKLSDKELAILQNLFTKIGLSVGELQ